MKLKNLNRLTESFDPTDKMPVLFLGHGSPMNAIEENEFVRGFRRVSNEIQKPTAILCVSAHWETRGTMVTAMQNPPTIHDFGGFPRELFEVQYPAPGNPDLARETREMIKTTKVELDHNWGLDHGAWSVIRHMYPDANIPVIQMSLDYTKDAQYHYNLAKELAKLREKGVLIVGSGNMVHNLRQVDWRRLNDNFGYDWAIEANEKMKRYILDGDHEKLINYHKQGGSFNLSIPSPDHYLPLLYSLALADKNESIDIFNDAPVGGSLTMTSVRIGSN
ncbi:4,5-DOPA-extradiol-dioxygenase [Marinigracilibium pacificum]|nr:4,5-DOPA dioxygenase extradiol [Marinigracilibium pacificum]